MRLLLLTNESVESRAFAIDSIHAETATVDLLRHYLRHCCHSCIIGQVADPIEKIQPPFAPQEHTFEVSKCCVCDFHKLSPPPLSFGRSFQAFPMTITWASGRILRGSIDVELHSHSLSIDRSINQSVQRYLVNSVYNHIPVL